MDFVAVAGRLNEKVNYRTTMKAKTSAKNRRRISLHFRHDKAPEITQSCQHSIIPAHFPHLFFHMTTFKHLLIAALVAAGIAFAAGCKNIPLDNSGKNIGTFKYGEFTGLLNTTAPVIAPIARDALKQLGLVEVAVTERKFENLIICHDEGGLEVKILIEEVNSRQTALRVRWGKGGDLERSRQLYSLVDAALTSAGAQTTATRAVR
jgi:hypothetical protein